MKLFLVIFIAVWVFEYSKASSLQSDQQSLKLVHTIFRHGNRNPENGSIWATNRFVTANYYPSGFGQLTNKGKLTEYNLGKLLRERYDSFLGDHWHIGIQEFWTTDVNRTKMSGLLVMAGLWPPKGKQIWSDELLWQPIPYNYVPSTINDPVLFAYECPSFSTVVSEVFNSSKVQNYLEERYSKVAEIVYNNTGISDYFSVGLGVFDVLKVQEDLGIPLDPWTAQVYPEPINSLAVDLYNIMTSTTDLRRILAGSFLKKVITDTQNVIAATTSPTQKLFAYSAHDFNVATVVLSLGYSIPTTPPYGSGVIFEVHEIDQVWGIKLFYNDYTEGSPHPFSLPGCELFCPLDNFTSLLEEILPTTDVCNESDELASGFGNFKFKKYGYF